MKTSLDKCYADGKKATPEMLTGKVTFHVAFTAGKSTCVVPSDDTGLTQDTEECMRTSFMGQSFDGDFTSVVPVALTNGTLAFGAPRTTAPTMETVESQNLSEEIYDVVEKMLPALHACTKGIPKSADLRTIQIGGVVGADGTVECAIASSPAKFLPKETRQCMAGALGQTKFPKPRHGRGLVSLPINIGK